MIPDIFNQDITDSSVSLKRMNQSKAYLLPLRTWENNQFPFSIFFKIAGGVREKGNCLMILRLPDAPKKHPCFFRSYLCSTLKQKALPARRAGAKQGG